MRPLSSIDKNAIHALEKYGELMLTELGTHYGAAVARSAVPAKRIERLAALGHCRIDKVGESTFAVFLKGVAQ